MEKLWSVWCWEGYSTAMNYLSFSHLLRFLINALYNCIEGTVINRCFIWLFICMWKFFASLVAERWKCNLFISLIADNSEQLYFGARIKTETMPQNSNKHRCNMSWTTLFFGTRQNMKKKKKKNVMMMNKMSKNQVGFTFVSTWFNYYLMNSK